MLEIAGAYIYFTVASEHGTHAKSGRSITRRIARVILSSKLLSMHSSVPTIIPWFIGSWFMMMKVTILFAVLRDLESIQLSSKHGNGSMPRLPSQFPSGLLSLVPDRGVYIFRLQKGFYHRLITRVCRIVKRSPAFFVRDIDIGTMAHQTYDQLWMLTYCKMQRRIAFPVQRIDFCAVVQQHQHDWQVSCRCCKMQCCSFLVIFCPYQSLSPLKQH